LIFFQIALTKEDSAVTLWYLNQPV